MNSGMTIPVEVISADINRLSEDLLEEHSVRLYSRGGHFSKNQLIPVYFMLIYGCTEEDEYNNFLYSLKDDMIKSRRPFAVLDSPLSEPTDTAIAAFSSIDRSSEASMISGLCLHINIQGSPERTAIAQKALGDILTLSGGEKFGVGTSLVSKINFISNSMGVGQSDKIPMLLYYGVPKPADVMFLCYAQRCGFDVLCISPDKSAERAFAVCPFADKMQKHEFPNSADVMPFPTKMVKTKISTVAYNAERELDSMLYGGDTMFRSRQFDKMNSAVLRTTYEEIELLWDQEAKYRSGFAVRGDRVILPTIFAKINGVPYGKVRDYDDFVENFLTPDTIYKVKSASYKRPSLSVSRVFAPYHDGTQINARALINSPIYKYGYLAEPLQEMIFEKMQAVIDDGLLEFSNDQEVVDYVMFAGLNLDKSILRLLQKYDYTREVPKFIVMTTMEEPFSKLECTQLLLMSYLGFDVIIFSPAGYRNIEAYVSDDAFEVHEAGDYMDNVSAPKLKIPTVKRSRKKTGLFKNLFKKGR